MEARSLLQSFAIAKDGRIVSVDEVPRGQACECTCPSCHSPLIARQGEQRVWHFAHATGTDCDGAESALHLAAKAVIERTKGIAAPAITIARHYTAPDGRQGVGKATQPELWLDFSSVQIELKLDRIIADAAGIIDTSLFLVEIGVTHFVDDNKLTLLTELGYPTIEVDLRHIDREVWDWQALEEAVLTSTEHKRWLVTPSLHDLEIEALNTARADAESKPLPQPTAQHRRKPPRTRYWPDGRMVDLIDYPFGVALWSPYDPTFNEVIKGWSRRFGGKWQPAHKNWLFSTMAKELLVAAIAERQTKPPMAI